MSTYDDTQLIAKYAVPLQKAYLDDDYDSYRTVISLSSCRSRHGEPLHQDAIEPTKELGMNFINAVNKKIKSQNGYYSKTSLVLFLRNPIYSVNQRAFGFINNNYGYYVEGITTVPQFFGTEHDVQLQFDCIDTSDEKPVIVEKVHVKKITDRMPSAADYVLRRFKQKPFKHGDVIYLSSHELNV